MLFSAHNRTFMSPAGAHYSHLRVAAAVVLGQLVVLGAHGLQLAVQPRHHLREARALVHFPIARVSILLACSAMGPCHRLLNIYDVAPTLTTALRMRIA